jgi:hypothetical protein
MLPLHEEKEEKKIPQTPYSKMKNQRHCSLPMPRNIHLDCFPILSANLEW